MASADTRQLVTPGGHLEPGHEGWASGNFRFEECWTPKCLQLLDLQSMSRI